MNAPRKAKHAKEGAAKPTGAQSVLEHFLSEPDPEFLLSELHPEIVHPARRAEQARLEVPASARKHAWPLITATRNLALVASNALQRSEESLQQFIERLSRIEQEVERLLDEGDDE